jgi:hypothetical protein
MRDELAQPLKKQDLYEAGDHDGTILPRFYPGPLGPEDPPEERDRDADCRALSEQEARNVTLCYSRERVGERPRHGHRRIGKRR